MRSTHRLNVLACVAALVALLAIPAWSAPGRGGGKPGTPTCTLTLDDLAGDAITSDGLGAYEGSVEYDSLHAVLSIPKGRSLFMDFSDCDESENLSCQGAFGPDTTAGEVTSAVTLTLWGIAGAPDTEDEVGVYIEFQTAQGRWQLASLVTVQRQEDRDGDGLADRFTLQNRNGKTDWLGRFVNKRAPFSNSGFVTEGAFFMPWGAELTIQ